MKRATVFVVAVGLALLLLGAGYAAVTNFGAVHISDANPTGVPALKVNQAGAGKIVEFSDGGTPVFSINNGGAIVASQILSQAAQLNNLVVSQPTAAATATPAALIDSLAAGTNLLEIRDAATPVAAVNNGGNWIIGEADGTGVDFTWYSDTAGDKMLWDQSEEALTITGTNGQDALNVDDGNVDIADNVDIDGALVFGADGLYPLGYASDAQQIVCGTTATFTATTTITPTGLTTSTYVIASQITTPAAGAVFLTVSDPTTATFVLSSWESDYSAGTTGIAAHWCAIGDQ